MLSLDSGGNYHGYIGDLCRMAILGEPDAELEDLLAEIETIQRAAMKPIKAGVIGGEIYAAGEPLVQKSKHHNHMHFLAHGMGLVSHEAPRLTDRGPVPYDAYDADAAAGGRHGGVGRDHAACIRSAASSSSRTRWRHRYRPRDLRRGRARLEQGRDTVAVLAIAHRRRADGYTLRRARDTNARSAARLFVHLGHQRGQFL